MKKLFARKWLVGAAGMALVAAPVTQLVAWGTAGASVGVDTVQYLQTTGSSSSSFKYVPGNGSSATVQPLTLVGHDDGDEDADDCATPTASGAPLLGLSAQYYNHTVGGVAYTGTPSSSVAGMHKGATGVCAVPPQSSIEQNEALKIALGSNALVAGRLLMEAQLPLRRADRCSDSSVTVTLIERHGATVVGSQTVTLAGGAGTQVTADTGVVSPGFDSVEIRVTSKSGKGSVSLVGPAATLSFVQLPQTISFTNTPPASPSVGDIYTVTATATSGLPVTLSIDATSTSGCTINGSGLVTLTAPAGTCVVDADQAGNALYLAAPRVHQTVTSAKVPQTITFTNTPPSSPSVGDTYTVTATATSGLPVTFSVDATSTSGCTVDGSGLVTLTGPAGLCVVDADQSGSATYLAAPQVQQSVGAQLASQHVDFTSSPPDAPLVGDSYTATATSSSGLPVTFSIDPSSTSGCTVDGSTGVVTFSAPPGSCVIDADQSGDSSFAPAPQVQQSTTVNQNLCGQQTIDTASTDGTETSGEINTSITFKDYNGEPAPTSVCKTYSAFSASANDPIPSIGGHQTVTFDSNPLSTAHLVATITWAIQGYCTPDGSAPGPLCPPTFVSFDHGATWTPQTFCTSAEAAGLQWCTTAKSYHYTASGVDITETWDGFGDPLFHNGAG